MIIEIDTGHHPARITLLEPDVFTAFSVQVAGPQPAGGVESALDRIGRREGDDHVFVDVDALKALAGERAADAEWLAQLDGMLGYAQSKGWVDAEGGVRAHIEREAG